MALSVLNNIASLAAQNQLTITNGNLQKALFQLSSGSRINTGADDAAGLAIADGLHANITALTQSARNANDGVGELQVADGSLAQVTTLLNRAVTLATESATGTVSDPQRVALDDEFTAIKAEIDRIGLTTKYNAGQVFTNNVLNVFTSDGGGTTSNSLIGVTTGTLSATGLSLGGAVAATGTLTQATPAAAVAATDSIAFLGHTIQGATTATGTLATLAVAIANNEVVNVGDQQYKFVTNFTGVGGVRNEVLIGADNSTAMHNLADAINAAPGTVGVNYGVGTIANTFATAVQTATVAGAAAAGNIVTVTASIAGLGVGATGNGTVLTSGTATTITSNGHGVGGTLGGAGATVVAVAGDTATVGGTTYTFVNTNLSSSGVQNEVLVGAAQTNSVQNLAAAITQANQTVTNGFGTQYSAQTIQNANVTAAQDATVTTIDFKAKVAGAAGNNITGTQTLANGGGWSFLTQYFGDITGAGAGVNVHGADVGPAKNAVANDTVTIGVGGTNNGAQTFKFVSALSTTPTLNEVLVGADEAHSLANLANAINGGTGSGSNYSSNIVANSAVTAATGTAMVGGVTLATLTLTDDTKGLAGNTITTQTTGTTNNAFGAGTLTGGLAGSTNDLLTQADATAALTTITSAVATVAGLRGAIGATVNRLQSAATVITNQVQNLTGAEDGVRAADIPSTVATLAKYSILEQTGISALAQANQQQQLVLKLLQ